MPWYEFEQVEVLRRAFWVLAPNADVARERRGYSGSTEYGVPDYAGNPSSIRVVGRGQRVRDAGIIDLIEERADDLGVNWKRLDALPGTQQREDGS